MSIWETIGNILGLVPKAIDAIGGISKAARTGPPRKPIPWGRGHYFTIDDVSAPYPWTYSCQYCHAPRIAANLGKQCPGPQ